MRTQVYVTKVIMDGKKAMGVETADGEKSMPFGLNFGMAC